MSWVVAASTVICVRTRRRPISLGYFASIQVLLGRLDDNISPMDLLC